MRFDAALADKVYLIRNREGLCDVVGDDDACATEAVGQVADESRCDA